MSNESKRQSIGLGDVVSLGWIDGYDNGTVCKVNADGTVDVFRPYVHTNDFTYGGALMERSSSVLCYIGVETTERINPKHLKLIRKSKVLR